MSAAPRGTASQYSKGLAALRGAFSRLASGIAGAPDALRWVLCAVGLVGAILLIVSEFTTVTHVKVITVVLPGTEVTGFDQNDGAMLVLGLVALLIALIGDLPDVTKVGTVVRERYEDAKAEPQAGFYLETLGAVLL